MFELPVPFTLYNTQYKKNFVFKYTNLPGDFIDENGVVHLPKHLTTEGIDLQHISKAGLI